jgi:hypothetical protein
MTKILLTGANGLLGQKLVDLLAGNDSVNLIATARGNNRLPHTTGYAYQSISPTVSKCLMWWPNGIRTPIIPSRTLNSRVVSSGSNARKLGASMPFRSGCQRIVAVRRCDGSSSIGQQRVEINNRESPLRGLSFQMGLLGGPPMHQSFPTTRN